jgi:DNA-binding transcriptional ArsR family regulator
MSHARLPTRVGDRDQKTSEAGQSSQAGGRSKEEAGYLERVWSDVLSSPGVDHSGWDSLYEWPPAHVPAGRRFEPVAERVLEPIVRDLASRLPGSSAGVLATAEFAGPSGIADLVAVTRAQELLPARLEVGVPVLSSLSDTSVIAAVSLRRSTTASEVAQAVGMSEAQVARRLRQLRDIGVLTEYQGGYRRHPAFVPVGRMYAFEAKVSDWRRATAQALRYARWADAAGIVLLRPPRDLEGLQAHARALRIGVAVGSRWLVRPVLQPVSPGLRLLASEMFIASLTDPAN